MARTEVIAANNEGILRRYEKYGIEQSQFLASPDACAECIGYDGEIYATRDAHGIIPVHPQCRCRFIGVTEIG